MEWLKSLVPLLGNALGGPLGGAAASFIADKLGIESKTIEAVSSVLNEGKLSPEQIASLKLAEIDFQKFLKTNAIDLEKVHSEDRKSARDMLSVTRSRMPAILTCLITAGFFGVLGAMFAYPDIKESAPLMIMLGSLGTAWTGCCSFWFGTTANSADKTHLLANSKPANN
jgi:hypothetical protein